MSLLTDRGVSPGDPLWDHDDDPEALFKEAHGRGRRRRRWIVSGVVLALILAGIVVDLARSGPGGPSAGFTHRAGGSKTGSPARSENQATGAGRTYPAVQVMGLADASVGWAASANGLFLTTDQGRRWRTITPPNLANAFVAEHVGSLDAIGRSDLWLVLIDVPGLVPYSQSTDGSDRGEGIDRSTDGGRTWTFSALPGCLQACGANLTVSFVDPEHGFATNGPDDSGPTMLFATDDGGATWTPAGNLPDLGSILVGGPGPGPQMEFTSALDGWAVTGPLDGYDAKQVSPGGVLYRTVDGGTSWTRVSGLPAKAQYSLPTVFGTESAVVLSNPEGAPDQSTSVFVTHNDGQTWTAHRVPISNARLSRKGARGLQFRFAAVGPASWKIDLGSALYSTVNAGRTWVRSVPWARPVSGPVVSAVFSSPRDGMALLGLTECLTAGECLPSLTITTDGGHRWEPVRP
jgi:photosystem II stability/assembly factor-like uncharacterized protein